MVVDTTVGIVVVMVVDAAVGVVVVMVVDATDGVVDVVAVWLRTGWTSLLNSPALVNLYR